jgi:flagellar L-ring protein precursor FlgH
MTRIFFSPLSVAIVLALGLSGCASNAPTLAHSPQFAPVLPVAVAKPKMATGAIFNGLQGDNWFGRVRSYNVGDLITVVLEEKTVGGRKVDNGYERTSTRAGLPIGLQNKVVGLPKSLFGSKGAGLLDGLDLNGDFESKTAGKGKVDQSVTLDGAVSVTVAEVLANGNLMVRGEKQMALTEGSEVIQVSGIVRPEDISANNTVESRRLANAQFIYRGTGDLANAGKVGWGTSALLKFWPF